MIGRFCKIEQSPPGELLVQPYPRSERGIGAEDLCSRELISETRVGRVTMNVVDRAAELRTRYRLSTPDAIQLATAIGHNATRFYGNDRALRRVKELECVIMDDVT